MMPNQQRVELQMPFRPEYLPLATGCVEQAVQAYGMGRGEAMHLALAVEEVYSFLANRTVSGQRLRLSCRFAGYYAEVVCRFQRGGLPVEAFNITATVSSDDEKSLDEMGLLLAARTVDQLRISAEEAEMGIHFIKEKVYPPAKERLTDFVATGPFRPSEPEAELLKQFAVRVCSRYGVKTPPPFQYPGKLADMVRFGEYGAVLLVDGKGNVGAGMLWHCRNKMAEAYGPFVFCDQPRLATQGLEACLAKLARQGLLCLVVQQPPLEMPDGFLEPLEACGTVLYRQLEEDNGSVAYIHPDIADFYRAETQRLFLPRQLHPTLRQGEAGSPRSAFSVRMNRPAGQVLLTALWVGDDAGVVLQQHVAALRQAGFSEIAFQLDAGEASQAELAPALAASGFVPRYILPWGGRGDVLVWTQREEA